MQKRQENFIRMAQSVQEVLSRREAIWHSSTAFVREQVHFKNFMDQLLQSLMHTQMQSKGVTEDKEQLKTDAVSITVNLAKRASVYALDHKDMELFEQLHVTKGNMHNNSDNLLLAKLHYVQKLLMERQPLLEDYSITPENLQQMGNAIKAYETILAKPRDVIVERKVHHYTIAQLIVLLRQTLFRMDYLINIFDGNTLVHEYKSARIIIDLGIRHNPPATPQV